MSVKPSPGGGQGRSRQMQVEVTFNGPLRLEGGDQGDVLKEVLTQLRDMSTVILGIALGVRELLAKASGTDPEKVAQLDGILTENNAKLAALKGMVQETVEKNTGA